MILQRPGEIPVCTGTMPLVSDWVKQMENELKWTKDSLVREKIFNAQFADESKNSYCSGVSLQHFVDLSISII